ncbi:Transposable element Tc1 transposase [Araneus ventricosus]|uniref:Transposable element Tc1 transposase n=1 Tax=Araneus ventricosus TaxID=182803 RepID=A0A4Y2VLK2_ARAVE|nr:Transposable element Tc1 transposase [Araneus ventricosus]
MPFRRRRRHYQQLTEFERGRVVGIREGGFSLLDIAERLGRNVSTVHDCWKQWSKEGTAARRPRSARPRGTTEREDCRVRRLAVAHRTASAAEIRAAVGTTVTERTVTNRLLQGQLRARRPVACIPLTPNHCRFRREWCQARAHWRIERRSVVLSDESRFCLGARDGRVVVRRRSGERLQPTCLRPRHTGPTPGLMIWGAIFYDSRSTLVVIPRTLTSNLYVSLLIQPVVLTFMNSIQGGVSQQDNTRPHTAVVTQHVLQSVDMLPWTARLPDLSPIEHVWDIIERQLQCHPQPALTVPKLTDHLQQAWNSIPQTDIRHLYDTMHARLHAYFQNSDGYIGCYCTSISHLKWLFSRLH